MVELEANLAFEDAKALVRRAITQLGASVEVAGKLEHSLGGAELYVIVIEKFFLRTGDFTSLTIVVTSDEAHSCVEAIPSGAGEGVLNIRLGADMRFAEDFEHAMRAAGYE